MSGCVENLGVEKYPPDEFAGEPAEVAPAPAQDESPDADGVNRKPAAKIVALVDGRPVPAGPEGVPVTPGRNVTFDASNSTDPDGDKLRFTWSVDGTTNRSATSARFTTNFTDQSKHRVGLLITDGVLMDEAQVTVVPFTPTEAGTSVAFERVTFKGTLEGQASAAGAGDIVSHAFNVTSATKQITAWLQWVDLSETHAPVEADLDLALKNPKGELVVEAATSDYEYIKLNDTTKIVPGQWTADIDPYQAPETTYELTVLVWNVAPTLVTFTGDSEGVILADGTADYIAHEVSVPDGTALVAARLTLVTPTPATGSCSRASRATTDYDVYAYLGEKLMFQAANGVACEFGHRAPSAGETTVPAGKWEFRVAPFVGVLAGYTLTVEYA